MTMHIHFKRDHDGHKAGETKYVERTLARRFCENGIAITYQAYLDQQYDAEQADKAKRAEAARVRRAKEKEKEKADELKAKEVAKAESADSKKAAKRSKSTNK